MLQYTFINVSFQNILIAEDSFHEINFENERIKELQIYQCSFLGLSPYCFNSVKMCVK